MKKLDTGSSLILTVLTANSRPVLAKLSMDMSTTMSKQTIAEFGHTFVSMSTMLLSSALPTKKMMMRMRMMMMLM